ncbi:hypothetical protein V6N11_019131 [Hibiscus sabdariffa]|uniref:Uncharacterized protein n=1 Tax=Hibiscus sabdariffa TaxID=183260 RepID=A0ABR2R1Y2_9ROSI
MELLHSIIVGRKINVGWIIIEETFKCIEKVDNNNLLFSLLISNICTWQGVPLLDSDETLVVKGTVITITTCRQLKGVESKEKGKGRVKESTPKPIATKSVPATPTSSDSIAFLTKVLQNHELFSISYQE